MTTLTTGRWLLSARGDVVHRDDCDRKGRAVIWRVQDGRTLEQILQTIASSPYYRACTRCMSTSPDNSEQLELGQHLRDEGTAAALAAASDQWRTDALAAIDRLAARPEPFTADDVRDLGVSEPSSAHAWGALFQHVARQGLLRRVGYAPSRRASVRRHPVALWEGQP